MTLRDRLLRIVEPLPPGASVSLPVDVLRTWLEQGDETPASTAAEHLVDLTAVAAAGLLGRAPSTVRGWCASGALPGAYRLQGREWRVPRASLAALRNDAPKPIRAQGRAHALDAWRQVGS